MKKVFSILVLSAMILGLFAGCGSNNGGNTSTNDKKDNTSTSTNEKKEENKGGETATEEVKYVKDIKFGIQGKIISIDVQDNSNTWHNYFFRMNYDTPIHFNNETLELEPSLATEWSTEDAITYTFKLREGVKFHNGEEMKASDWKYTYERALESDSSVTLAKLMKEIRVVDDYTVEIELYKANVDFPYQLTLPTASIINEKACTEDPEEGVGIGTGCWKLDSYEFGDFLKLVRHDEYWDVENIAKADSFTMIYMPEDSSRLIALETGEIDICQDPANLELSHIEDTEGLELQSYTGTSITYMAMNYKKGPFVDQNLRLAMCYGIDCQELLDVVMEGKGALCNGVWGWNQFAFDDSIQYTYNPELAKEYLAKAGYNESNPFSFTLAVSAGVRKQHGELIQAQLKKIGVDVKIEEFDTAGLSQHTTNGDHEAALYGCGMNVFADDARRLIMPGTGVNKSHYDNADVNALMDAAVAELDNAKRVEMYKEVQKIMFEDGAYLPILFADGFFGVREGTGGIDYYPTSHHDMSHVYIIEK